VGRARAIAARAGLASRDATFRQQDGTFSHRSSDLLSTRASAAPTPIGCLPSGWEVIVPRPAGCLGCWLDRSGGSADGVGSVGAEGAGRNRRGQRWGGNASSMAFQLQRSRCVRALEAHR
jgi:hypothetical protein